MSNVFLHTTETTFDVPKRLVDDGLIKKLRPSSLLLYLRILQEAQEKRRRGRVAMFKTSSLLAALAITPRHLRIAIVQLQEYHLVASTEVSRGSWRFELLKKPKAPTQ
jgi:hypothetical protein